MDINDLRALITVVTFMAFIGIVVWAWSGRRREEFEQAARMALDDDAPDSPST
jgi:cytochrome c oxidase cbb3-type subunit IV